MPPSISQAEVLPTHTPELFEAAVRRAAQLLREGQVVALPTETVYGLAANALNAEAIALIFKIKGRPAYNPIIVHVASNQMARQCTLGWPAVAEKLARAFWPGPLTLVLPRAAVIPPAVTAGGPTVGVRWPSHPFIQAVIRECGFPLAAPSANLSSQLSPTDPEHVRKFLGDKIPLIVDGGPSQVGIESTVLDVSVSPPQVLRPGMIDATALLATTGELSGEAGGAPRAPKSPGLLRRHYSPKARLVLVSWQDSAELRAQALQFHVPAARVHVISHTRIPSGAGFGRIVVMPHDPAAYGRALYAELYRCDEAGAKLILVEPPPQTSEWHAIADRLGRAASVPEDARGG
ncbi:Sua5/YciO/YrdC/YwlC family protein [Verrucomicrobia bacterium]|nr:Sua5/YciO/YrdC/YwlC family protein [Verrucomicrobiota bacterium]